jgi:hypothetical protein
VLMELGAELLRLLPVDQVAEGGGGAGDGGLVGALLVALYCLAAGFVADGTQAQAYLLFFHVDLDDFELVLVALVHLGRRAAVIDSFRDVAEAFDSVRDFNECAKLRGAEHLAVDDIADAMGGEEALPDIGLKLLDAE